MIKSRRMRWAEHVAWMGEKRREFPIYIFPVTHVLSANRNYKGLF
jgi:hypothetical protein